MGQVVNIMGVTTSCSDAVSGGTGTFGCPFKFQVPDGIFLLQKGYYIPSTTDVTKAFMLDLVQKGTAIPLLDAFNFEPINEDDVMETSNTGINALARKGLTTLKFTYKKGIEYEKAIEKLTSFGVFDVWVVDKTGNMLGIEKSSGFGGFTAGLVLAKSKTWNTGSESESKAIEIQFTQPGEFKFVTWIEASQLDFFIPTEIDGINATIMEYADANGPVAPADTDLTLKVSVFANDRSTPVTGLALGDFDSTSVVTAVVDDGGGYYTLTVTALVAAATETTKLYDVAGSLNSVNVSDILFSGSVSATVA